MDETVRVCQDVLHRHVGQYGPDHDYTVEVKEMLERIERAINYSWSDMDYF